MADGGTGDMVMFHYRECQLIPLTKRLSLDSQMSISRRELTGNANDPEDDMRNGGGKQSFSENKMEITLAVQKK